MSVLSSSSATETFETTHDNRDVISFPTVPAQERIWFHEHLYPKTPLYNVPIGVCLDGDLAVDALEEAINDVIARHDVLRTTFHLDDTHRPIQVVANSLKISLNRVDLSSCSESQRTAECDRLEHKWAAETFDLEAGPLIRAHLVRLRPERHHLLLVMHHIVIDAHSVTILLHEIGTYYGARLGQFENSTLSALPLQFGDVATSQREESQLSQNDLEWWRTYLRDCPHRCDLPFDRAAGGADSFNGNAIRTDLPKDLHQSLAAFSVSQRVTSAMTMLAAFSMLLHRLTGQCDLVIGMPVANRPADDTAALIGLFINALPIRIDLTGDPSFREILQQVRRTMLDVLDRRDTPFEEVVEIANPVRSTAHAPLFNVLFTYDRSGAETLEWPLLKLTPLDRITVAAKYDLTFHIVEGASALTVWAEYNTSQFDSETIERMLKFYSILLAGIADAPDRSASSVRLLPENELDSLGTGIRGEAIEYPSHTTVDDLVAVQARRKPGATAIESRDSSLTYEQLQVAVDKLATILRAHNVGRNQRVGLCMNRTPSLVVSMLAILRTGAAYVPLDPAYPKGRLAQIVEDSDPSLILTEKAHAELFSESSCPLLCTGDFSGQSAEQSDAAEPEGNESERQSATPTDPAYIIHTSGSTGRPKGVVIPHRAIVNLLWSMRREPGFSADDVMLAITTLSFDISVLEILLPLVCGGRVVIATREETLDPKLLSERIRTSGATVMQATPATWKMLLMASWEGNPKLRIFCGGETLSRDLANSLLTRCAELWNLYGPTETTVWSALSRVEKGPGPIVIGHPIGNTQIHILDRNGDPTPTGVIGELYIGGDGLAIGYWKNPDQTAERFITSPCPPPDDASAVRLYRTGDLARRCPDDTIELLGRVDAQIKLRGHRVEPGEIETAIRRLSGAQDAVVVARPDDRGDVTLIAYIVGVDPSLTATEMRSHLLHALPDYMIPELFVVVDSLPLTPNGKIDRRALPEPQILHTKNSEEPLLDECERSVAAIWSKVLNIPGPNANDNFFDLGGTSLRLAHVQALLKSTFGVELSMATLFRNPTIRMIANKLKQDEGDLQTL